MSNGYKLPHAADSLDIGKPRVTFTITTPNDVSYSVIDYGWQIRLNGPYGGTLATRNYLQARDGYRDRQPSYASAKRHALAMLREIGIIR